MKDIVSTGLVCSHMQNKSQTCIRQNLDLSHFHTKDTNIWRTVSIYRPCLPGAHTFHDLPGSNNHKSFTKTIPDFQYKITVLNADDVNTNVVPLTVQFHAPDSDGSQWRTQEFFLWVGSINSVEDRGQRERGSGGGNPISQRFHSICKRMKPIFWFGCYGCILQGTGNSA
jgi:hypothetical protein